MVGACTVEVATAASTDASRPGSGVNAEQLIDALNSGGQVGAERQLVHDLRPQPVQLHRGPGGHVRRQPAGFVRWFLDHNTDGTR